MCVLKSVPLSAKRPQFCVFRVVGGHLSQNLCFFDTIERAVTITNVPHAWVTAFPPIDLRYVVVVLRTHRFHHVCYCMPVHVIARITGVTVDSGCEMFRRDTRELDRLDGDRLDVLLEFRSRRHQIT